MGSVSARFSDSIFSRRSSRSSRWSTLWAMALSAPRRYRSSSAISGTAISAALLGVDARRSAT